jgi:hypothetical protein
MRPPARLSGLFDHAVPLAGRGRRACSVPAAVSRAPRRAAPPAPRPVPSRRRRSLVNTNAGRAAGPGLYLRRVEIGGAGRPGGMRGGGHSAGGVGRAGAGAPCARRRRPRRRRRAASPGGRLASMLPFDHCRGSCDCRAHTGPPRPAQAVSHRRRRCANHIPPPPRRAAGPAGRRRRGGPARSLCTHQGPARAPRRAAPQTSAPSSRRASRWRAAGARRCAPPGGDTAARASTLLKASKSAAFLQKRAA